MGSESRSETDSGSPPAGQRGADAGDRILAALDHLRGIQEAGGDPSRPPPPARQEAGLLEWAQRTGLRLTPEEILPHRAEDNLGVFDAHEKNLIRAGADLIPFDVIPCHPGGGFLEFIRDALGAGHHLEAVRTISTGPRKTSSDQPPTGGP